MKIVIDIDDEIAKDIIKGNNYEPRDTVKNFRATIACAIKYGTILPKGHGDLIDRNELLKEPMDTSNYPSNYVRIAKAIIEADTEESEAEK